MTRSNRRRLAARARKGQRGAALIVGMVLLVVLTLLAISGMNTATTELLMAGNEKYQENAFQAAETGIERTIATTAFNPAAVPPAVPPPPIDLGDGSTYEAVVLPRGAYGPPPNYSLGSSFATEHFEIQSTGNSLRNATSTHTQGLFLIVPSGN
ncbi:MAG TPA: pilus assembly PilX N-terminal domain-containing protein [Steroidobacteraceae bacterium]|nr:pilus assembly PilX N-terminal domain-containing protein [Steroidobacteraceae bacterium]